MPINNLLAEVILPLPVKGTFTYVIPDNLHEILKIGMRVIVPFGAKKFYSGIVKTIFEENPDNISFNCKPIVSLLDDRTIINKVQLRLWTWMSEYYMSTIGEVMNNALPNLFKISSETFLTLNPNFGGDVNELENKELSLIEAINTDGKISVQKAALILELKNPYKVIFQLIQDGIVELYEEINNPYSPRFEDFITISEKYRDEDALNSVFDELQKRAYKQLEFLLSYFKYSTQKGNKFAEVSKLLIYKSIKPNPAALNALLKKGIISIERRKVNRIEAIEATDDVSHIVLSDCQEKALNDIKTAFVAKDTVLLHGVTSSGKTEIYFKLMEEAIKNKQQVLFLLPEIALTTQIVERTVKYFGKQVGVYHSKFNHSERLETWNLVLDNNINYDTGYNIIIGARSSIFLPFNNLGLIIVDEEHDYSYKQNDSSPRYNGRDSAIVLAKMIGAKVLLGSATPSVELYFNFQQGKYGLVELKERYGGLLPPEMIVIDMKDEMKNGNMKADFSLKLLSEIDKTLQKGQQVLIFQNRRGYALHLECEVCGWVPECTRCDVALIYHKVFNQMRCHYCGFHTSIPTTCPKCHSNKVFMKGTGTEQIEEELQAHFPAAVIKRMDLDTTKRKYAFSNMIADFSSGKINILVGTQMITKGLDFDNVGLVGIVSADNLLYFPDFRAFEKSFQQICQVSGRAGRKNERGKVMIQTFSPYHSAIVYAINNDYDKMYSSQISERSIHKYPPYYRLIAIKLKHSNHNVVDKAAEAFANILKQSLGDRVLGPEYHYIPRINNYYIKNILVKIERNNNYKSLRQTFTKCYDIFTENGEYRNVRISLDVDPY